ncbi:MAG: hypothetical protein Q9218_005120, partial [Villophora microphyllina]
MTSKGFPVFYYDRLGVSQSQRSIFCAAPDSKTSRVSGYTIQFPTQVQILGALSKLLRAGEYTAEIGKPDSIVLVGHQFVFLPLLKRDPEQPHALTIAETPNNAGEDIKIGLESYSPRIANTVEPRFSGLDTGYLFFGDIFNHVNAFFAAPNYEVDIVEYAQSIAQPFAIVEWLSRVATPFPPNNFSGPVLIAAGEYGFITCGGDCPSTFSENIAQTIFQGTQNLETYVHPGSGQSLNFHKNATGFY